MIEAIIIIILIILYFLYVILSFIIYQKYRKRIKIIIHVNGIRGKSTVTRLIDAGLRECGYKVFSKTTGTIPTMIDTNNKEIPVKRLGPANIKEQLKIVRKAAKEDADILVLECMAVNPEYQYICEHRILHSNIGVITNVRYDHLDVMGESLEEIAYSLSNTTPKDGILVLGENNYKEVFDLVANKVNAKVEVADELITDENLYDTFKENISVALKVCDVLNLDKEIFKKGMLKYHHDPGALKEYIVNNCKFINGFSINDPDSIIKVYDLTYKNIDKNEVTILLNEREDRPFRVKQHIEMLSKMNFKKVIIMGSNIEYIKENLKKYNINSYLLDNIESLLNEKYIFGCGNIAGKGIKVINFFERKGGEK